MKKALLSGVIAIAMTMASVGCGKENKNPEPEPTPEEPTPANANTVLSFKMEGNRALMLSAEREFEVALTKNTGEDFSAEEDITCSLALADNPQSLVNAYNSQKKAAFALLPEGTYSFEASTIAKGAKGASLKLKLNQAEIDKAFIASQKPFVLPVKIAPGNEVVSSKGYIYVVCPAYEEEGDNLIIHYSREPEAKGVLYNYKGSVERAVLLCPGGAYSDIPENDIQWVVSGNNGFMNMAQATNSMFAALYYSYPHTKYYSHPFEDAYDLLSLVRARKGEWGGYDKVGVWGMASGGHIATTLAVNVPEMLDFQVLMTPLVTMQKDGTQDGACRSLLGDDPSQDLRDALSNEKHTAAGNPPAYIAYAANDQSFSMEKNAVAYEAALKANGVAVEIHSYNHNKHNQWWAWTAKTGDVDFQASVKEFLKRFTTSGK